MMLDHFHNLMDQFF